MLCGQVSCSCGGPYSGPVVRVERVLIVGDVIATENVYGEDAEGKRRLLDAEGDSIPEEEAKGLEGGKGKAKPKPADKARGQHEDKGA